MLTGSVAYRAELDEIEGDELHREEPARRAPAVRRHHDEVGTAALPWLSDHQVHNVPALPGAAYCEMALSAGASDFLTKPFDATDVLLRTVGGADAVNARTASLGVQGVRVDRPTVGLIGDWVGVRGIPADYDISMDEYRELARATPAAVRDSARAAFDSDPRDTSTPAGMVALLERVAAGAALSEESAALLLDIMTRSTTGGARIKGHLPEHVEVAHKTGTIGGTTNDVGIITLPGDAGRIAIAMFVKGSPVPVEQREHTIAEASRAIYDYFLFQPRTTAGTLQTRQGS